MSTDIVKKYPGAQVCHNSAKSAMKGMHLLSNFVYEHINVPAIEYLRKTESLSQEPLGLRQNMPKIESDDLRLFMLPDDAGFYLAEGASIFSEGLL